jgi:hypothetical protein
VAELSANGTTASSTSRFPNADAAGANRDDDYIRRSGDTSYRAGQRLIVRATAAQECLAIVEKLAAGMADDAGRTAAR